jgi:(2Fe-2S) ferredoxin
MSFYAKHVFSAATSATAAIARAATTRALEDARLRQGRSRSSASGEGKVRINQAGCLDRCEEGPCIVVYPDAVWYTYVDQADIDEIIEEHLKNGRIVERLRM